MKRLILAVLCVASLHAQIALIASGGAEGYSGTSWVAQTGAMNATGGNFIAACVETFGANSTTASVSDNVNGAWTNHGSNFTFGGNANLSLWWKANATVSSSLQVSVTLTSDFPKIAVGVFSNVTTSSPRDGTGAGATASGAGTLQPGSITPAGNNELGISCGSAAATSGNVSISGNSYLQVNYQAASANNNQTVGMGYVVQTTGAAANPTWNFGGLGGVTEEAATQDFFTKQAASTFIAQPWIIRTP